MFAISLVVIAGLGFYQFFLAKPFVKPVELSQERSKVVTRTQQAKSDAELAVAEIQKRTWNSTEDQLQSTSLEMLTKLAETNHLQLTDFRTDKHNDVLDLHETPFVVVVEGTFPDVLTFVDNLESPSPNLGVNLAVNMLQVASSDSATGHVTATIGLVGFIYQEKK